MVTASPGDSSRGSPPLGWPPGKAALRFDPRRTTLVRNREGCSDKATMTRADLREAIWSELGLTRLDAARLVDGAVDVISERLSSGEEVQISSFGRFASRDKKERLGRNPRTGEPAAIPPRRVAVFRPSRLLKRRIQQGLAGIGDGA